MDKLAEYLLSSGRSQRELAAKIAIHPSVLSKYLSGAARPTYEVAFRIETETEGFVPLQAWVIGPLVASASVGGA